MYNELQDSLKNIKAFIHLLLEVKPKEKEVQMLREWNATMEPFRVEARRIQYELIQYLKGGYNENKF